MATAPLPLPLEGETSSPFNSDFLKKLEYLYVVSKKLYRQKLKGERRAMQHGSSVEFRDYRDYSSGDDFRYIDWNIFRRLDRLLVKLFEEEQEHDVTILVDSSRSMHFGSPTKLLYAKQIAAALAYISLANHDRVGVVRFSDQLIGELPRVRGKGQIWNVFQFLERDSPDTSGGTALAEVCREVAMRARRPGIAILLSDLMDARPGAFEEAVKHLTYHRFEVYVIHIVEPGEENPTLKGDLNLVDSESGEVREVSIDSQLLRRYQEAWQEFCEELQAFCRARGLVYLRTDTTHIFDELILRVFRQGGFLE